MKLHRKDQAEEGEKEPEGPLLAEWEPSIEGYLRYLVNTEVVHETLERIVEKAAYPSYAEFRNSGLELSEKLVKDLELFKEQGHAIPEPSIPGISYAHYLQKISEKDPPAFLCHLYEIYFGHKASGVIVGRAVAGKILEGKVLEYYKWNGNLQQLLENVRAKLNKVSQSWSREEKGHCLDEIRECFKYLGDVQHLILS